MNSVTLIGNLGQDPELRYTGNQVPVCNFSIATTKRMKGQDGQTKEMTEWHRIIAWQKLGENCNKYLQKGKKVAIQGEIRTRAWEDKQGVKRHTTEIIALNVEFLSPAGEPTGRTAQSEPLTEDDLPF